jgi:uncharacterized protein YciI
MPERPTLDTLLERLHRLPLYCVLMRPTERWDDDLEHTLAVLVDHLLFLERLELEGVLFASGPLDVDEWRGDGLSVIRADSTEHAASLMSEEPFAKAGLRTNEVRAWQLNEGQVQVTIDLFAGRGRLR